jgi:hypothetical protein
MHKTSEGVLGSSRQESSVGMDYGSHELGFQLSRDIMTQIRVRFQAGNTCV